MTEPAVLLDRNARSWTLASAALALLPLLLQLPPVLASVIAITAVLTAALSWRRVLPMPVRLVLVLAMLATIVWQMGMVRPGRDTGCALLAAMLAIKSSELRNLRDARSLLGFALFSPFAAFLLDQGAVDHRAGSAGRSCRTAGPATAGPGRGPQPSTAAARTTAWCRPPAGDRPATRAGLLLAVPALVHAAVGRTRASGGHTGHG